MKRRFLVVLCWGMLTTPVSAATLSMRFAGGGSEITLGPSQTATIEVVITMGPNDYSKSPSRLTGLDARFDVGSIVPGAPADFTTVVPSGYRPEYILDGSTEYTVDSVSTRPGWTTAASTLGPFNAFGFFLSTNDPSGVGVTGGNPFASYVVASFVVRGAGGFLVGDTFAVFRVGAALPGLYNQGSAWTRRWGYGLTGEIPGVRNQFTIGQGNPGDAGPLPPGSYHGYEILRPLTIHSVPEPSSIALMVLGGLAALRSRN